MGGNIKYVVVMIGHHEVIVVFPSFVEHKHIAMSLVHDMADVISAGFCFMRDELNPESKCYGSSVSLNLKSRYEEDTYLLRRLLEEV